MKSSGGNDNPVMEEIANKDIESAIAVAGHPIHAMAVHFPIAFVIATLGCDILYWWFGDAFFLRAGLWTAGFAFVTGVAAGIVGTAELLLVAGIRGRVGSWTHAIAAMTLLAIAGMNWGIRLVDETAVLPHGLILSILASIFTGLAGYHGGKLVFHHGVGIMVSTKE